MERKHILKKTDEGISNLIPMVTAIIIAFAIISIGIYIMGTMGVQLQKNIGTPGKTATDVMNFTFNRMNNTSRNWDSVMSVVNIAIIITVLAMAIGAIFLFAKGGQ